MDAREWKDFYARERDGFGEAGLRAFVESAPVIEVRAGGALVFPHTRLKESGRLVAAVARALVHARVEEVLALGVLHQCRRADLPLVRSARAGDSGAIRALRRVHGPGVAADAGRWTDEYSLDNLVALVGVAARMQDVPAPRILARFPFLVGSDPQSLPGLDELRMLAARGCALVATTDPVHHGAGYGTPLDEQRALEASTSLAFATSCVEESFGHVVARRYVEFERHAAACRSDFRDNGPVLGELLSPPVRPKVHAITLVDYSATLDAPEPTWVAATLSEFIPG